MNQACLQMMNPAHMQTGDSVVPVRCSAAGLAVVPLTGLRIASQCNGTIL